MGVESNRRVEQPIPALCYLYQNRLIAFCMFNYFYTSALYDHRVYSHPKLTFSISLFQSPYAPSVLELTTIHIINHQIRLIKNNSILLAHLMQGKYHDGRVYQHFVHTYSRVPYLDHQIFNIETHSLRQSRKANQRALTALQGLERAQQKSE